MTRVGSEKLYLETSHFIAEYQSRYLQLLSIVKRYLEGLFTADSTGRENVYRIYSRKDSSGQISELKSIQSLVEKLERLNNKGPNRRAIHVNDIVACRFIVYYRYQIQLVVQKIRSTACSCELQIEDDEYRDEDGYHAHHLVLSSKHQDLQHLRCEVQVKTVLHDAWAAKTHGFTYKPRSQLSPFDVRMMQSFGDGVEALEAQSELLRLRWAQEREASKLRQKSLIAYAASKAMFGKLDQREFGREALTDHFRKIYKKLVNSEAYLLECSIDDATLVSIVQEIDEIRKEPDGIVPAFRLMLLAAAMRRKGDLNDITKQYMEEWIGYTKKEKAEATYWRSSVYYTIGEMGAAIAIMREYLSGQISKTDTDWYIKFNLINYICHSEMIQTSDEFLRHKEECQNLIADLELNTIKEEDTMYAAVQDTLGAYLIAFGSTEKEIYKGIRTCQSVYNESAPDRPGLAFRMLHERIGWTKLLSIEQL